MLQLLRSSIWVTLGATHCRRGSSSLPARQNSGNRHSATSTPGLFPATRQGKTSWCPEISMLAPLTLPQHTILCTDLSQPLWGQASHPILVAGTAWAPSPHLSPSFFLLKTRLPSRHPWAWRNWELLELSLPGDFPLYGDVPPPARPQPTCGGSLAAQREAASRYSWPCTQWLQC